MHGNVNECMALCNHGVCLFVSVYVLPLINSYCLICLNVNLLACLWLQVATSKRHVALCLHLSCQVTSDRQTNTHTHSHTLTLEREHLGWHFDDGS